MLAACGIVPAGAVLSITIPVVPPASGAEFAALKGKLDIVTNEVTQPQTGVVRFAPQLASLLLFCTLKNITSVSLLELKISVPGEHAVAVAVEMSTERETSSWFVRELPE
jgi:hypothetical protein